tara:strand:+ start:1393 stop:2457 length:1065 start_codon:yes stop_codon:yes gene_type:complete
MEKNFLITTGGSGGHVLPAVILYEHLSKQANMIISTDKRGLKYLDQNIYNFEIINTPKLNNIFLLPLNIILVFILTLKSIFLLKRKKIQKIFSTGGYMSLPVILAGRFLNSDIYLLEPNQIIGRSNKYFLKYCIRIFCYTDTIKNFPEKYKNKIVVINPLVREHVYKKKSPSRIGDKLNLLIVGGSQGANIFDKNIKNSIVNISKKIQIKILQQTKENNIVSLTNFYSKNNLENEIFSFDKNFTNKLSQINICITRAGASTLAELSVMNIPFIAVPLPSSKDNHQLENANFYKNNGCCWVIEQKNFEEKIEDLLNNIIKNENKYLEKKKNLKKMNCQNTWNSANQKILRVINEN